MGVLVVGGFALLCDRVLLGTSQTDVQSATADVVHVESPQPRASENTRAGSVQAAAVYDAITPSVAQRLEEMAESKPDMAGSPRDGFTPPESWTGKSGSNVGSLRDQIDFIKQFQRDHKLLAVMTNAQGQDLAIVDGQPVAIGQRVGVFTLVEIRSDKKERAAIFESRYGRTELLIADVQP